MGDEVAFVEQPQDSLFVSGKSTSSAPANVKCLVKNSIKTIMECNNQIRDDVKRTVYWKENVKYELLSLNLKKRDFELNNANKPNAESTLTRKNVVCKCVAFSAQNEKLLSSKATVKLSYLEDYFQSEPIDETYYEGDTIEMRCDPPKGEPEPSVYWLKDNQQIKTHLDSSRFKISNDFSLLILEARLEDSGNYVCVAWNNAEKRLSKPARLTLIDKAKKYFWSEWSNWSECSNKCGLGVIRRTRACQTRTTLGLVKNVSKTMCETPAEGQYGTTAASYEDQPCEQYVEDSKLCAQTVKDSAVYSLSPGGHWSEWSNWSECNPNTCAQYRKRSCRSKQTDNNHSSTRTVHNVNCQGENLISRPCPDTRECLNQVFNRPMDDYSILNDTSDRPIQSSKAIGLEKSTSDYQKISEGHLKLGVYVLSSVLITTLIILLFVFVINLFRKNSNRRKSRSHARSCRLPTNSGGSVNSSGGHSSGTSGVCVKMNDTNFYYTCEKQFIPDEYSSMFKFASTTTTQSTSSSSPSGDTYSNEEPSTVTVTMSAPAPQAIYTNINESNHHLRRLNYVLSSSAQHDDEEDDDNDEDEGSKYLISKKPATITTNPINNTNTTLCSTLSSSSNLYMSNLNQIAEPPPSNDASSQLFTSLNKNDLCLARVGFNGARLTLDCGISLLVPEGALVGDNILVYLAVCRNESFKPKLNDRATYLSEIISIGVAASSPLVLHKPVVLTFEHNAKNVADDWNVQMYHSASSIGHTPAWQLVNEPDVFHLNQMNSHFVLMSDQLGSFILTGEPRASRTLAPLSKFYRLVVFCATSITNNDFILRIYCLDSLLVALEEIIRDEMNMGGCLLETSEPFELDFEPTATAARCQANQSSKLKIILELLNDENDDDDDVGHFKCKYDVNSQEIPLSHIWNGRNHLLYCSFNLEKVNSTFTNDSDQSIMNMVMMMMSFNCRINAFKSHEDAHSNNNSNCNQINHYTNENDSCLVQMKVNANLFQILNNNNVNKSVEFLKNGLKNWNLSSCLYLNSYEQLIKPSNLVKNYFRVNNTYKQRLIEIIESNSKNWKMFAKNFGIKKPMSYFEKKSNPGELLLIYFEAISDLILMNAQFSSSIHSSNPHVKIDEYFLNDFLTKQLFSKLNFLNFNNNNNNTYYKQ